MLKLDKHSHERISLMKRSIRVFLVLLCMILFALSIAVPTFGEGEVPKQGWVYDTETDNDGNEVIKERYYVNGVPYKSGNHQIGA